jgi:hypothetical protein
MRMLKEGFRKDSVTLDTEAHEEWDPTIYTLDLPENLREDGW